MRLWRWLRNRYGVTFGGLAILATVWNLYVAWNDDGILAGRVIGPDGRPVAGATVVLSEKTLLVSATRATATTDAEGRFRFTGHQLYHLYLEAYRDGVGRMPARELRLYFKGQNVILQEPLRLEKRR
jgi:hypothetical protein